MWGLGAVWLWGPVTPTSAGLCQLGRGPVQQAFLGRWGDCQSSGMAGKTGHPPGPGLLSDFCSLSPCCPTWRALAWAPLSTAQPCHVPTAQGTPRGRKRGPQGVLVRAAARLLGESACTAWCRLLSPSRCPARVLSHSPSLGPAPRPPGLFGNSQASLGGFHAVAHPLAGLLVLFWFQILINQMARSWPQGCCGCPCWLPGRSAAFPCLLWLEKWPGWDTDQGRVEFPAPSSQCFDIAKGQGRCAQEGAGRGRHPPTGRGWRPCGHTRLALEAQVGGWVVQVARGRGSTSVGPPHRSLHQVVLGPEPGPRVRQPTCWGSPCPVPPQVGLWPAA